MLYKRDKKGDAYAKLLNVRMYIHFSEKENNVHVRAIKKVGTQ